MKELEKDLLEKGVKPTAMRLLVLNYLRSQAAAQSLTDIEMGIDTADRVTIYRTIRTFEESGMVHRIDDGSGTTKFSLCAAGCSVAGHQDLHVHFYCDQCRETHCLPAITIPEPQLPANYQSHKTQITVTGICASCAA